jgi:hypothetical protein
MEDAAVKALNAGVDVLLISQNTRKGKSFAAERAVVAIRRALADGWLSRSRVADALRPRETTESPPGRLSSAHGAASDVFL